MKTIIIGTYLPRKCGIATFTHDLYKALKNTGEDVHVLAISDGTESSFPKEVSHFINQHEQSEYRKAAEWINENYDCCIIQHEYGIFGGTSGQYILTLLDHLQIPVICNLHTVLIKPSSLELKIVQDIAIKVNKITVMTNKAIDMLVGIYGLSSSIIEMIPHGIPNFKISHKEAKDLIGFADKTVLLSFGLLGRNKGYEVAIEAISKVASDNFVYIILGATHPNVIKHEGEVYRNSLIQKAATLGLTGKVIFVNRYVSDQLLEQYLKACDIYISPYPNENQISSGTLSFAVGAGATVVSTPYWYAKDLLANDIGCLFDFNDANSLATIITDLINNPKLQLAYSYRAHHFGKSMTWNNIGKKQIKLINELCKPTKKTSLEKWFSKLPVQLSKNKLLLQNNTINT